jgi:hypothetical protein
MKYLLGIKAQVIMKARVKPILWCIYQSRFDRIPMNITHQLAEIFIGIDKFRLESSLKKGAYSVIAIIYGLGV